MIIESEAVGPFFKNGFVVGCEATRDAVLIDPQFSRFLRANAAKYNAQFPESDRDRR